MTLRRTFFALSLLYAALILASCREMTRTVDVFGTEGTGEKLDRAMLTFYFYGREPEGQESAVKALEKALKRELNVDLDFRWETSAGNILQAFHSGEPFDGGGVYALGWDDALWYMDNEGIAADLSELIVEYACEYSEELPSAYLESFRRFGRLCAVPAFAECSDAPYALLRTDIREKYGLHPIDDWDALEEAAAVIRDNEPEMTPISFYTNAMGLFAGTYGYRVMSWPMTLVYRVDDPKPAVEAWELTDAYPEAIERYADWYARGFIGEGMYETPPDESVVSTGRYPLWIGRLEDVIDFNSHAWIRDADWAFEAWPLPTAVQPALLALEANGFYVSASSPNPERVMMFVEWVHRNQENYDLFHYGVEGEHYGLVDGRLAPPRGVDMDDAYFSRDREYLKDWRFERPALAHRDLDFEAVRAGLLAGMEPPPHLGFWVQRTSAAYGRSQMHYHAERKIVENRYDENVVEDFVERSRSGGTDAYVAFTQDNFDAWFEERHGR